MNSSERRSEALDWVVRTNDPDFSNWDEFTQWLEQSPGNADAYHRLLASEEEIAPYLRALPQERSGPELRVATPPERRRARAPLWLATAGVAAALTAIVAPRFTPVEHVTRPGEMRIVSLGGRDEIVLNGGTRMVLAGFNKRQVRLEQGQILLSLREPGASTIEVESGDLDLVDIGTVFEVTRSGTSTEVAVSEGSVVADPKGARLQLKTGQGLSTADGASVLKAKTVDPAAAGGFARGQLVYRDEPIERVLADLHRSTGLDFDGDRTINAIRFTGTLSVKEVKRDPRSLEPLLGVRVEGSDRGWRVQGRG